jgi:hypothetical protein
MTLRGEWNGEMRARRSTGGADADSVFLDVRNTEICRKQCRPVNAQEEMESRRYVVWQICKSDLFDTQTVASRDACPS